MFNFTLDFYILGTRDRLKNEDLIRIILISIAHQILSKNALTNWYFRWVSSNQVIREFNKTI